MLTIVEEPAEGNSCGIRIHLNRKKKHHIECFQLWRFGLRFGFWERLLVKSGVFGDEGNWHCLCSRTVNFKMNLYEV